MRSAMGHLQLVDGGEQREVGLVAPDVRVVRVAGLTVAARSPRLGRLDNGCCRPRLAPALSYSERPDGGHNGHGRFGIGEAFVGVRYLVRVGQRGVGGYQEVGEFLDADRWLDV